MDAWKFCSILKLLGSCWMEGWNLKVSWQFRVTVEKLSSPVGEIKGSKGLGSTCAGGALFSLYQSEPDVTESRQCRRGNILAARTETEGVSVSASLPVHLKSTHQVGWSNIHWSQQALIWAPEEWLCGWAHPQKKSWYWRIFPHPPTS